MWEWLVAALAALGAEAAAAGGTAAAGTAAAGTAAGAGAAGAATGLGVGTGAGLGAGATLGAGAELGAAGALGAGAGAGTTAATTGTLTAAELAALEAGALGGGEFLTAGGAAEGLAAPAVTAGAETEAVPMTFDLSLDTTLPDAVLSYENPTNPVMQFQSSGLLSNPEASLVDPTAGFSFSDPSATASPSWMNWANVKDAMKTGASGATLASMGKELMFPSGSGAPVRPAPVAQQPSVGPYRGPTSDLMMKLLHQRMGSSRVPPLTFR